MNEWLVLCHVLAGFAVGLFLHAMPCIMVVAMVACLVGKEMTQMRRATLGAARLRKQVKRITTVQSIR
jgi:hypothetical protein